MKVTEYRETTPSGIWLELTDWKNGGGTCVEAFDVSDWTPDQIEKLREFVRSNQ